MKPEDLPDTQHVVNYCGVALSLLPVSHTYYVGWISSQEDVNIIIHVATCKCSGSPVTGRREMGLAPFDIKEGQRRR